MFASKSTFPRTPTSTHARTRATHTHIRAHQGLRSPNAAINNRKDPYENKPDSPTSRTRANRAEQAQSPGRKTTSHLSIRQSLHSPRHNEMLTFAERFNQLQSATHTSSFRGSREVLLIISSRSVEWWSGKSPFVGRDKYGPQIVDMVME